MRKEDLIRTVLPPPGWLQKVWEGANERGLDKLSADDIDAEIAAYRRERAK